MFSAIARSYHCIKQYGIASVKAGIFACFARSRALWTYGITSDFLGTTDSLFLSALQRIWTKAN
jgi:hypothetical protein